MSFTPSTLLFLDIESTGLSLDSEILEIGAILVRAKDLVEVARFSATATPSLSFIEWDKSAVEMHSKNGLFLEIRDRSRDLGEVLDDFEGWLKKLGLPAQSCVIAGSSIHSDVAKLENYAAGLVGGFSYRLFDVSTLRMYDALTQGGKFPKTKTNHAHRAILDCEEDIAQLKAAMGLNK